MVFVPSFYLCSFSVGLPSSHRNSIHNFKSCQLVIGFPIGPPSSTLNSFGRTHSTSNSVSRIELGLLSDLTHVSSYRIIFRHRKNPHLTSKMRVNLDVRTFLPCTMITHCESPRRSLGFLRKVSSAFGGCKSPAPSTLLCQLQTG